MAAPEAAEAADSVPGSVPDLVPEASAENPIRTEHRLPGSSEEEEEALVLKAAILTELHRPDSTLNGARRPRVPAKASG